jgi:hypothetical protein
MVEGKAKPEARAEGDTKRKPAPYVATNPALISTSTETVDEDFIRYLRTRPMWRPTPLTEEQIKRYPWMPEATREADALTNKTVDLFEYILKEHDEKGYALVGVERFDDGTRRFFRLEATA